MMRIRRPAFIVYSTSVSPSVSSNALYCSPFFLWRNKEVPHSIADDLTPRLPIVSIGIFSIGYIPDDNMPRSTVGIPHILLILLDQVRDRSLRGAVWEEE
jgi:hypothetical protein